MDPVVHFELPYDDADRVVRFYAVVFGWKLQPLGAAMDRYILATTAEADVRIDAPAGAINGGLFPRKPDWPAQQPSVVIGVADIRATMNRIDGAGGRVLGQPMTIPGVGEYVAFLDSEGNRGSVLQAAMAGDRTAG